MGSDASNDADGSRPIDATSAVDALVAMDGFVTVDAPNAMDTGVLSDRPDAVDAPELVDQRDVYIIRDVVLGMPGTPVNLGTAGNFVILAKTGISSVPQSAITGDIGVSPAAATYLTGFSLTADPSNVFSRSPQLTGRAYAANYAVPTPANLTAAVGDMEDAFTDAAGRAPGVTELGAGNIGGMTLRPGVYAWGTGLLLPTDVTLRGAATDVWIFQIAQGLTLANGVRVMLAGGAVARNVFWQVSGSVTIGTTAHCEGVILARTNVTLRTGASINGRLLAQTAVSIDGATVVQPAR